jgi:hypothetical protein
MDQVFLFFADELTKLAGSDYYQRNRGRLLAKGREYRQAHGAELARKKKAYNRKVKSGAIKQRARQRVGNSFVYTGLK